MTKSMCGLDCEQCGMKSECKGCAATDGKPFGGSCMIAECCKNSKKGCCGSCWEKNCDMKSRLMDEFNALGIEDMPKVENLWALRGSFVNLEYTLPSGQKIKFWDDDRVYLGNQLEKKGSDRCYGLTAD